MSQMSHITSIVKIAKIVKIVENFPKLSKIFEIFTKNQHALANLSRSLFKLKLLSEWCFLIAELVFCCCAPNAALDHLSTSSIYVCIALHQHAAIAVQCLVYPPNPIFLQEGVVVVVVVLIVIHSCCNTLDHITAMR